MVAVARTLAERRQVRSWPSCYRNISKVGQQMLLQLRQRERGRGFATSF